MPKLTTVHVVALKDTTLQTGSRVGKYLDDSVAPKPPEWKTYEQKHGMSLRAEQEFDIDLTDAQIPLVQEAVARGDISASGLPKAASK